MLDYAEGVRTAQRSAGAYLAPPTMKIRDDRELMRDAQAGDDDAFAQLVRRHQKRIYHVAIHLLRDGAEAEDIAQETFVRAYASRARFDGRSQPYTWLYRIAVNLSLNRLRSRKRTSGDTPVHDPRLEPLLISDGPHSSPESETDERRLGKLVCQAIDELSETLRTTLILAQIEGLPHGDIATILGCPEGTIAWRVHEARKKLKSYLAAHGYGAEECAK